MIRLTIRPNTAYVYHMLSVARCGYDNDWGRQWRSVHPAEDLELLHCYERELTICGGEHVGKLCGLLAYPAAVDTPVAESYHRMGMVFATGDVSLDPLGKALLESVGELRQEAMEICQVMERNVPIFLEQVWLHAEEKVKPVRDRLQQLFDERALAHRACTLLGIMEELDLEAILCPSMANGAEAIFISENQDVFGIDRSDEDAYFFIGHEYIIRLLMAALQSTSAFQGINKQSWLITEGMAEYYIRLLEGTTRFFNEQQEVAAQCALLSGGAVGAPEELYQQLCALYGLQA